MTLYKQDILPPSDGNDAHPPHETHEGLFDAQLLFPENFFALGPLVIERVAKRNGREEAFDKSKIAGAIFKAAQSIGGADRDRADSLASAVSIYLGKRLNGRTPMVDEIHDAVEKVLIEMGHAKTALAYARYRDRRDRVRRLRQGDLGAFLDELHEARNMEDEFLGLPHEDVARLIEGRESASGVGSPADTGRSIAATVKRFYASKHIFGDEIAAAHDDGRIHLHGLDTPDRFAHLMMSLDFLKRFGPGEPGPGFASTLPSSFEQLAATMIAAGGRLADYVAHPVAWRDMDYLFAPFLTGYDRDALSRAARSILTPYTAPQRDAIHINLAVPPALSPISAIGPGGVFLAIPYGDFRETAHAFAVALLELVRDAASTPMPPVVVWCSQSTFEDSMLSSSVALLADCVASRANITVMFHGTNATQAFQRESGVAEWVPPHIQPQRVTLNLCRLAARTNTASSFFEALPDLVELALKAHDRKRLFLDRLLARGVRGPLGPFAFTYDGAPLFDPERAEWITGFTGLNECVSLLCGSEMHESPEALTLGAQITSTLNDSLMQAGLDRAMRLTLAPSDMPGIAQRFALLDLKNEPARVRSVFKIAADGVTPTYTSGLRLRNDAPMNILERLRVEGMLHEPVPGCTVSEAVLPDEPISRQSIAGLLYKTVRDTAVQGVRFRQPVLRV